MSAPRVGVVGLGRMGLPIAANLVARGFAVTGFRRSGGEQLVAAGGRSAASPAEVAAASDVVITILPSADAVERVVLGEDGLLAAVRPGTVLAEMSTVDLGRKTALRDVVAARGAAMLDCAISGTPGMVAPRLATVLASGEPDALERARPVLEAVGPLRVTGAFGTGSRTKFVTNLLVAAHVAAAAEAVALVRRWGLDPEATHDVLGGSMAASAVLARRGPAMPQRAWHPAPSPIDDMVAVLTTIEAEVAACGVAAPVLVAARSAFERAATLGWGGLDVSALYDLALGADALDASA